MRNLHPDDTSILWKPFERKNQVFLSLAVLGGFKLTEPPEKITEKEIWEAVKNDLPSDQTLDTGMPKPKGEVLVAGSACQPNGKPGPGLAVSVKVGAKKKELYVFGNRHWKRAAGTVMVPSDPENFTRMPITWSHAFGGPGFALNPIGKGFGPVLSERGSAYHQLPNIENPKSLVCSRSDHPDPAGFGPLDMAWPQRIRYAGTYDDQWLKNHWPYFPEDMDWTWFNAAPSDQWINGYFKGNEPIEIVHMHPQNTCQVSRLPGQRARCFIRQDLPDGREAFKEVKTHLETVWLFPNSDMGVALHRGVTEICDDEAEDVRDVFVEWEHLAEPHKSIEYYREYFLKKLERVPEEEQPETPPASKVAPPESAIPEQETPLPPPIPEMPDAKPDEGDQWVAAQVARAEKRLKIQLANAGLDPDRVLNPTPPPGAADLSEQAIEKKMMDQVAQAEKQVDRMLQKEGLDRKTILEQMAKRPPATDIKAMLGKTAYAIPAEYLPELERLINPLLAESGPLTSPPPVSPPPDPISVRDRIQSARDTGESLDGLDLSEENLSHMDLKGLSLKGAILRKTDFTGADLSEADLSGADLTEAVLANAVLRDARLPRITARSADFTQADLSGADLSESDLKATQLSGASLKTAVMSKARLDQSLLTGADLTDADLSETDLTEANLSRAVLKQARMVQTTGEKANLTGADLTKAILTEADFTRGILSQAILVQAEMTGANLEEAVLVQGDLNGIHAAGAIFSRTDCSEATFKSAHLDQADFSGTRLNHTDFTKAHAAGASFSDAVGDHTRFEGADLAKAGAGGKTHLFHADFKKADLAGSSWGGADLSGADFSHSRLNQADFTRCKLPNTIFQGVHAREASFMKADLTGADLRRSDFFQANFRKARLMNAAFYGASLYSADFFRATFGKTDFRHADLTRTLLAGWRPS